MMRRKRKIMSLKRKIMSLRKRCTFPKVARKPLLCRPGWRSDLWVMPEGSCWPSDHVEGLWDRLARLRRTNA